MSLPPFYSGTELNLQCTSTIPVIEDKNLTYTLDMMYEHNRTELPNNATRVTIEPFAMMDDTSSVRFLTISPLVQSYDIGQWTCAATTSSAHPFIEPTTFYDHFSISTDAVSGKQITYTLNLFIWMYVCLYICLTMIPFDIVPSSSSFNSHCFGNA